MAGPTQARPACREASIHEHACAQQLLEPLRVLQLAVHLPPSAPSRLSGVHLGHVKPGRSLSLAEGLLTPGLHGERAPAGKRSCGCSAVLRTPSARHQKRATLDLRGLSNPLGVS